jgi:hypothetical protein
MSTDIKGTLNELARMQPAEGYVLSVYVNAAPDAKGRRNFNVFLKKKFNEIEKGLKPRSPEAAAFPANVKEINRYLEEGLRPESKGAAVFISQTKRLFTTFQTALPLENRVVVSRVPFIYPLARIADDYDRYGILISDEKHAKLLRVYLGQLEEEADIITAGDDDTARGFQPRKGRMGRNDDKHQRHLLDLIAKHVKATLADAKRFFPGDIVCLQVAAEKGTLAEIQRQLPSGFRNKMVATASFDIRSPAKKVLEESIKIFHKLENQGSQKIARELVVAARSRGNRAALGTKATMAALQDGRAEKLVVSERFAGEGWQCTGCLKMGAVGKPRECVYCGGKEINRRPDLKEEMVSLALRYGAGVEFVEGSPELDANGGIGVLLKSR